MKSRRELLVGVTAAIGLAVTGLSSGSAPASTPATRLILLGTGGGPRPRRNSFPSSQVIVANDRAYVVDCGDGVATQLVRAGVPLTTLRHVFITHHHSDHNADYGNLLLLAWASGLRTRVDTWGPPPLAKMTRLFIEMNEADIMMRQTDEGKVRFRPLIHAHEIRAAGKVVSDANVTVTCALVDHPPCTTAFAYRFDAPDRSIVISGDTRPSDALVRLAKGADVLVHEALFVPGVDRLAARVPNAARLKESILSHHTTAEDAGRIATAAGVKTLVLSHFVPPDDPEITEEMWFTAARSTFKGNVVVGRDLMEV